MEAEKKVNLLFYLWDHLVHLTKFGNEGLLSWLTKLLCQARHRDSASLDLPEFPVAEQGQVNALQNAVYTVHKLQ